MARDYVIRILSILIIDQQYVQLPISLPRTKFLSTILVQYTSMEMNGRVCKIHHYYITNMGINGKRIT